MAKKTVSGTKEWATTNENCMIGCAHGCLYCYACANAARFKTKDPQRWTIEEVNEKALKKKFGKREGTIMFPTTHDLHLGNMDVTIPFLKGLLETGNEVLVVSKPHLPVIKRICEECSDFKEQILFRFTIGAADDGFLWEWEPGAPPFRERLYSLHHAYRLGFKTSVSMEPLLEMNEDEVVSLVKVLSEFVTDYIWIGKMNKVEERLKRNGFWDDRKGVQKMADLLMKSQTDDRIKALYERLKDHCKVKWKESIKKVVGLEVPTEAGLDI